MKSSFIGNICIEADGKETLRFPVLDKGKEDITLALIQSKTIESTDNKSVIFGIIGDVTQEFSALKDGMWKDIKGLQFYIKEIKGKTYVILKGFANLRETLKGTKYLLSNPQVGTFAVTAKDGKANFTDIAVNLLTGIGKALIAYWIGTAVVAGGIFMIGLISTTVALPAIIIFSVGAIISIFVGVGLNMLDNKYSWTISLQKKINEIEASFNKKIDQIEKDVDNAIYRFYEDFRREFYNWLNSNGNIGVSYEHFR